MIAEEEDSGSQFEVFCCIAQRTVDAIAVLKGTTVDAFNIVNIKFIYLTVTFLRISAKCLMLSFFLSRVNNMHALLYNAHHDLNNHLCHG